MVCVSVNGLKKFDYRDYLHMPIYVCIFQNPSQEYLKREREREKKREKERERVRQREREWERDGENNKRCTLDNLNIIHGWNEYCMYDGVFFLNPLPPIPCKHMPAKELLNRFG